MTPTPELREDVARGIAGCCKPGGACYEAGLSDIGHTVEPPPSTIYILFTDGGNLRKWSADPFGGAIEFTRSDEFVAIERLI